MLSDVCSDFLNDIERATSKLADVLRWYSAPDYEANYGEEIDALLRACARVQDAAYDDEARVELLRLTASVMRLYDA